MAYSPLGQGAGGLLTLPEVLRVAEEVGRPPAQARPPAAADALHCSFCSCMRACLPARCAPGGERAVASGVGAVARCNALAGARAPGPYLGACNGPPIFSHVALKKISLPLGEGARGIVPGRGR